MVATKAGWRGFARGCALGYRAERSRRGGLLVFLILIAGEVVLAAVLLVLPYGFRSFIADLLAGALVAPLIASVVTLIYYRLTAAHGEAAEPGGLSGPGGYAGGGYPGGGFAGGGLS